MKKLYNLIVVLLFVIGFANAQTISNSVIASAGTSNTNAETGISMSWTLGEPVIGTLISDDETIILTQGFQQGSLAGDFVSIPIDFSGDVTVYPNPVSNIINIKVDGLSSGSLNLEVFDAQGRLHSFYRGIVSKHKQNVSVNATLLNPGVYMLRFLSEERVVKTVRLIKQ